MKPYLAALFLLGPAASARAEVTAVPHPDQPMPPNATVVWSPLFQATWDHLNRLLGGPPVRVDPPNPLMERLDHFTWRPDTVMPPGSWKTWGGPFTPEFLARVNREAAALTGAATGPFTAPPSHTPRTQACYGLLDRRVEFARFFSRSQQVPMTFTAPGINLKVPFFGVRGQASEDFRNVVRVLSWRPIDGSHALQIKCRQPGESVVLFLPPRPLDFDTACSWLRGWRNAPINAGVATYGQWNDPNLHQRDTVRIPYVTFESTADFTKQLLGMRYFSKQDEPWQIIHAQQVTRFRLHEKGAEVRVEASVLADPFGEPPPAYPRTFNYDRPFFVFLWRDGADWPYFAVWLGDATALTDKLEVAK